MASLKRDREQWWVAKAQAMEKAFAAGDTRSLFQLIRSTGSKKLTVRETITEKDGTEIYSQDRRLKRWAEHFEEQFSHSLASGPLLGNAEPEWDVNIDCPTAEEVRHQITLLKRDKAAGPDGLQPALFKEGGEEMSNSLTNILRTVRHSEQVRMNGTLRSLC